MKKHWLSLLLAVFLFLTLLAGGALAAESPAVLRISVGAESYSSEDPDAADSDALLMAYLEAALKDSGTEAAKPLLRAKHLTADKLTGVSRTIYDLLAADIQQVASGTRTATVFELPVEDLGFAQTEWTAEELGVDAIVAGNAITPEAVEALEERTEFDFQRILSSLLADLPYDLYWFDKTAGADCSGYSVYASYSRTAGAYVIGIEGSVTFSFAVASEFASDTFAVDAAVGAANQAVLDQAGAIVDAYAAASDYGKLRGYCNEICSRVDYNYSALETGVRYGNPWQLLWVFDDDPETKVVCEGYSKAFQFLCDITSFAQDIGCNTVTGQLSAGTGAGDHMWNVVRMENDSRYLVDVTNTDSMAEPDDALFLAGYAAGDLDGGYSFASAGGLMTYYYDVETRTLYDDAELTLSDTAYIPVLKTGWQQENGSWYYYNSDGTMRTSRWLKSGENWYYLNADGTMRTGWLKTGGNWYYMNANGRMTRGWVKVSDKWYYMDENGVMQTGLQQIKGKTYYLSDSGVMQTGWKKLDGKWYYFDAGGAMRTGWLKLDGKWYFMDEDTGKMHTGWLERKGKWYYFNGSGVMLTGTQVINGKTRTFDDNGVWLGD